MAHALTALQLLQTGFVHASTRNPKVFDWMYKTRVIFHAMNLGFIGYGFKKTVDSLGIMEKLSTKITDQNTLGRLVVAGSVFLGLCWFGIASEITSFVNKYFKPKESLDNWHAGFGIDRSILQNIRVEWDQSFHQKCVQVIYLTGCVVSMALSFRSTSPWLYRAGAALQLYDFFKVAAWKWIRFDRKFNTSHQPSGEGSHSLTVSYFLSVFPYQPSADEKCGMCLEPQPSVRFCESHSFHLGCIPGIVYQKSRLFLENLKWTRIPHIVLGPSRREWIDYNVTLEQEKFPTCPLCRRQPPVNEIAVVIDDQFKGKRSKITANLTMVGGPWTYRAYNLALRIFEESLNRL